MSKGVVISLYDFTGEACRPWAEAGLCQGGVCSKRREPMTPSFGRDGIIAMTSSKTYKPVGFLRKVGAEYVAYLFRIENGFAQYGSKTNNINYARATGTTLSSKKRKDIADKVSEIYAASFQ